MRMHEPTQGVDVGASTQIFARIPEFATEGRPVLVASGECEDPAHLCDRVQIVRNRRSVSELHGSALTVERTVKQSFRDDRDVADVMSEESARSGHGGSRI
jgi:simple sugar transport system ATP-binding protein